MAWELIAKYIAAGLLVASLYGLVWFRKLDPQVYATIVVGILTALGALAGTALTPP